MSDFGATLIKVAVGGLMAYVVSSLVIAGMVTGTTAADGMIQDVLPIVIAAGVVLGVIVASFKNA